MALCERYDELVPHQIIGAVASQLGQHVFDPPIALRNGHVMTIFGGFWPRCFRILSWPCTAREFEIKPNVRVLAYCHWQAQRRNHPTVILVHGLEGSANSRYMLGTAEKAFLAGLNVLRLNVRNCGGTEKLTPTFYHAGLTEDLHHITRELIERDQLSDLFLIGFSMGGNQVLKFAGELGQRGLPELRGVCAISPSIELNQCAQAIKQWKNRLYELSFLRSLKATLRRKQQLFPDLYCVDHLDQVRRIYDFDNLTATYLGFRDALDYYTQASAFSYLPHIAVPTLIIHAQDDPLIPFAPFTDSVMTTNPYLLLIAPKYGGHVAFWGKQQRDEDAHWAENRAIEFCTSLFALSESLLQRNQSSKPRRLGWRVSPGRLPSVTSTCC